MISSRSVIVLASDGGDAMRLSAIVRESPHLMSALEAARAVDASDWLIGAGAIRDAVWDSLHDRPPIAVPRDVDLAFFDAVDLTPTRERSVRLDLLARTPDLPWEVKKQAAVHLWYPDRFGIDIAPFRSSAEAVATFPETASCVAVRLLADDDMLVVAPHGLDDLFGCDCRHNATRVPADLYERRVAEKGWLVRWPRLRFVRPDETIAG
jgi:hypothetical protein